MHPVISFGWLAPLIVAGAGALLLKLLAQDGAFVAVSAFVLSRRGTSLARVGLGRFTFDQALRGLGLGLALFVVSYTLGIAIDLLMRHLLPQAAYAKWSGTQWAGEAFKRFGLPWQKLAFALTGVIAAPFGEEAFFRGLIFNLIKTRRGFTAGVIGSALLFALAHIGSLTALCVIFWMGVALAAAYERTGSLWVPILMHSVNNALSFVLLWTQTR